MTDDQIFQKKQECAGYKDEIEKEIKDVNVRRKKEPGVAPHEESLSEIFYSPVKNSCLYSTFVVENIPETSKISKPGICSFYKIYNFLEKWHEEIYLVQSDEGECLFWDTKQDYEKALKELKWE